MEARNIFCVTAILWLSMTSGQEPPPQTTENPETTTADLPEVQTDPPAIESKEEEPSAVEEQPFVLFPENHKNFTPSQYLGDDDFPSYHNHLSSYQQQYKNYYEQKQLFNRKPIKFEEDSLRNFYVPSGEEKKNEYRVNHAPFPYVFEYERGHDQVNWHKPKGQELTYRHQQVVRGHQSNPPHYTYPPTYPQEEKFYKNEIDHYHHHHVKEKGAPWKKVFHVLTALVPLGLLLATLTPNVISINSTATTKTTRQRSEESSSPVLPFKEEDVFELMKKFGVESLAEAQCEDRIICEMAREGGRSEAGPVEKGFWFLANQTPRDIAEKAGMNDLFNTIKTGNCEVYKCHPKPTTTRKKLIRKHKIP